MEFKYNNKNKILNYSQNNNIVLLNKLINMNHDNVTKLVVSRDGKTYLHTITLDMIDKSVDTVILQSTITEYIQIPQYVHNWNKDIQPSDITDIIAIELGFELVYNSLLSYNYGIIKYIDDDRLKRILLDYFCNVNIIKYIGRQYYLLSCTHISKLDIKNLYRHDDSLILFFKLFGFDIRDFGIYNTTLKLSLSQKQDIMTALSKYNHKELYEYIKSRVQNFILINSFDYSKLGQAAIKVIKHQHDRIQELSQILYDNPNANVIFPFIEGSTINANNKLGITLLSNLGAGAAMGSWQSNDYIGIMKNLNNMIQQLKNGYSNQVIFGLIYPYGGGIPSAENIHVWGANRQNWNLKEGTKISGSGHADKIGLQRPGIFGIITTSY